MPYHELPSHNQEQYESLPSKERYSFHCKAIAISGRPGAGVSSTARVLAEDLQINLYDVGQIEFRTEIDLEIIDYLRRPLKQDKLADQHQKELLINATPDNPLLLVSRLAGIITNEAREENVVTLFLSCPRDIRYHRILEREKARGTTGLTLRTVGINTRHREQSDINQFKRVHPQIEYSNPFDPNAKDENGNRIYKHVVSSAKNTSKEIADEIVRILIEDGAIAKIIN